MEEELIRLTAVQVARELKRGNITPLDLIDAVAARIARVDPVLNALPTLCLDRARDHARRLMATKRSPEADERGWLGGIPVAIKDMIDVEGVRTTYGSKLFEHRISKRSHPLVERIEAQGGIVVAKSNTPEFGAGGTTFNDVFGRTVNPWNTTLTCGGSTGGGAAALASGQVWFAQGSDHGGSLRRPAGYCSVVGLRCSPGRVSRGHAANLWSPLSVQGPMARNVPDLALFLDAMAGACPHDPMSMPAPARSFSQAITQARAPKRVAFTADFGGKVPVDRETREICARMAARFAELGAEVDEASPDIGEAAGIFQVLRAQHMLVDRELLLREHGDVLRPDLARNIERGLRQSASDIAWAERERSALYRRMMEFMRSYDVLVSPTAATPAFDADLRFPQRIDGKPVEHYTAASLINAVVTLTSNPAISVPCGFDRFGRPIGLQLIGHVREESRLLQVAALFESLVGIDGLVPIDPRPGVVPPDA